MYVQYCHLISRRTVADFVILVRFLLFLCCCLDMVALLLDRHSPPARSTMWSENPDIFPLSERRRKGRRNEFPTTGYYCGSQTRSSFTVAQRPRFRPFGQRRATDAPGVGGGGGNQICSEWLDTLVRLCHGSEQRMQLEIRIVINLLSR